MAMESRTLVKVIRLFVLSYLVSMLVACPRIAYISIYNNTPSEIEVDIGGLKQTIRPRTSEKIQFTGYEIVVESRGRSWKYKRLIPHDGENGPYFDGTLKVQINVDYKAYSIPVGDSAIPLEHFQYQPEGYPLSPIEIDRKQ